MFGGDVLFYSFSFPEMLNGNTSNLIMDKKAVMSNLLLVLGSEKGSLFGDPQFGAYLKKVIFEQSNNIIVDLVIDEIYTCIITYIPQVFITRKDISLKTDGTNIYAEINCTYIPDNTSDLYVINLIESDL